MYRTDYSTPKGARHSTSCYARDPDHLAETLARRGMGERWNREGWRWGDGQQPKMPSHHLMRGELAAANHALVWIGMIAVRSDVADQWAMLNDDGLLHELAHLMHSAEIYSGGYARGGPHLEAARDLARQVEQFERLVPGVHPCWAGEDTRAHRTEEYMSPLRIMEELVNDVLRDQLNAFANVFASGGKVAGQAKLAAGDFAALTGAIVTKPKGPRGDPAKRGAHRQQLEQREAALQARRRAVLEAAKPTAKPRPPARLSIGEAVMIGDRQVGKLASLETANPPRGISINVSFERPLVVRKAENITFALDLAAGV